LTKTEGADITQYKYDVLGNLLSVQLPDGNLIEYIIDGRNRRIGKKYGAPGATVLQKAWLYKDGLNPIAELDWDPVAEVWDLAARFVYASRANVPDYVIVPAGQTHAGTYRIISDHLGSPRLVVDITDGSIKQEIAYDEWGQETGLRDNPDFPNPFTFAGGLYDADTKLIRFGARDYDPEVGRWTTKDPIRFTGGDTNLFGYVFQDPINLIDIMGLDIWVEGSSGSEPLPHQGFSVGKPNGEYRTFSYGMDSNFGSVYEETEKGGKIEIYAKTTPEQDKEIIEQLIKDIPEDNKKWYGPNTCRNYSQDKFDKFQNKYHLQLSKPPVRKEPERDLLRSPWSSTTTVTGLSTSSATPSGSSK
ncbi:MAG: RHS repeat-associated core domain-containing protein, partial [Nitrospinota bacterium]|nr:RHS repeat-associated core domain-containing protein [Nitrospinota bacterium]